MLPSAVPAGAVGHRSGRPGPFRRAGPRRRCQSPTGIAAQDRAVADGSDMGPILHLRERGPHLALDEIHQAVGAVVPLPPESMGRTHVSRHVAPQTQCDWDKHKQYQRSDVLTRVNKAITGDADRGGRSKALFSCKGLAVLEWNITCLTDMLMYS